MKARVCYLGVFGFIFFAARMLLAHHSGGVVAALCVFATYEVLGSTKLKNPAELLAMLVSFRFAVGHLLVCCRLDSSSTSRRALSSSCSGSFAIELKAHEKV